MMVATRPFCIGDGDSMVLAPHWPDERQVHGHPRPEHPEASERYSS